MIDLKKQQFLDKLDTPEGKAAMEGVKAILKLIGENPEREGLINTPKRVAKSFLELCEGLTQDPYEILGTTFKEGISYDEIVLVRNVPFTSLCEHHLLTFRGLASIAYLPNPTIGVVGLSKLARLLDVYARRPQVQERLTVQIADAIEEVLKPVGTAVRITSEHSCMSCRGVQKHGADMVTQVLRGAFRDNPETRQEFSDMLH